MTEKMTVLVDGWRANTKLKNIDQSWTTLPNTSCKYWQQVPFPMVKNEPSHFHTLEAAQTEAEFNCIILLVSNSLFVQGPLKAQQFWGKCVLKDALIPFTTDCLRHTANGAAEMLILSCKPGNISWLFQAVDAKVTLVCFVSTRCSLTFLGSTLTPQLLPENVRYLPLLKITWVKIWF